LQYESIFKTLLKFPNLKVTSHHVSRIVYPPLQRSGTSYNILTYPTIYWPPLQCIGRPYNILAALTIYWPPLQCTMYCLLLQFTGRPTLYWPPLQRIGRPYNVLVALTMHRHPLQYIGRPYNILADLTIYWPITPRTRFSASDVFMYV
jgi:hypothetical protein